MPSFGDSVKKLYLMESVLKTQAIQVNHSQITGNDKRGEYFSGNGSYSAFIQG